MTVCGSLDTVCGASTERQRKYAGVPTGTVGNAVSETLGLRRIMALILKNGAVFLHVPKTGGNWVTKILQELDLVEANVGHKHCDVDHFFTPHIVGRMPLLKYTTRRMFNRLPFNTEPYMFCFVRNPLTWYESWFKYMEQPSRRWLHWGDERSVYDWHPNSILNGLGCASFEEFVRNVNKKRPGYVTELYGWYTRPQMDFVGKQERLEDDLIEVLKTMNVDFDEEFVRNHGKVGVSPTPEAELVWPHDLKLETALLEYAGMIRYGYDATLKGLGIDTASLAGCGEPPS